MPNPGFLPLTLNHPSMTTDLVLAAAPLAAPSPGAAANQAAAQQLFTRYRSRLAEETRRRHDADLRCFAGFLASCQIVTGDLASEPASWSGLTWGLVEAFVVWQQQQGYAVGSINVRLSTVKAYARLAMQAGALSHEAYGAIRAVRGFRGAEGRRMDAQRSTTRTGHKKATPTTVSREQLGQLKATDDPRLQLLLCLLFDHGLRVGEIALLERHHFDIDRGLLCFYRPKVDKTQHLRLSAATQAAAQRYVPSVPSGRLFPGTRQIRRLIAAAGEELGIADLSPHDGRHSWATRALQAGSPLKAVQDAGGWASPAMPLRYAESAAIANEGVRLD